MKDFKEKFKEFLMQDKYITDECYIDFINKYKDILNEKYYIQLIKEKNKFLKYYNNKYLNKVLISKKDYFDNMFSNTNLNILLDDEQRKALIIDDNALVIAGAGAGKTTTMAAKVKYLVDNGYNEQDILVVSFTKKACEEIANIIHNDLNYPTVSVKTFHSLGLDILKSSGMDIDMIIEETTKYKIISNYIKNIVFKDKEYLKELIDAFKSVIYFDEEVFNYKEFIDYQKHKYNKKLLNSNLNLQEYNDIVINNRRNKKKTIKGDYVRSKEEVDIANYLFVNGINYKYEAIYKDEVNNIKSKPDFTIRQNSLVNYIEHFGIDKNFDNKMYDIKNLKAYLSTINIKEKYLNDNDKYKDFIITYSNYLDPNITYLSDLENKLIKKGYVLNRKSDEQIFTALMNTDTDSYFSKFIYDIVIPFISTFKRNNYTKSYFKKLIKENKGDLKKELIVLERIYDYYELTLRNKHYIDFEDMINMAYNIIPKVKESDMGVDYKYLIIDEYQDISIQRYNLTNKLTNLFDAKIMAVGDDWQTIFSFSGADIDLFRDFKKYVKNAKSIPITNTYRNSQELIDIAGMFIQKNKNQLKKSLKSTKHLSNPIEIFYYDSSNNYLETHSCAKAISIIVDKIMTTYPTHKILILGRYNSDEEILLYSDLFYKYRGKIKSKLNSDADITFLTIHKSKGLGYDDVILINGADEIYGFPSKIEDKPIIKLLKKNTIEPIKYPEERRLFYVAMTRTKNKFYITVPINKKSIFIKEISKYNNVISNKEIIRYDKPVKVNRRCPKCNNNLYYTNYKESNFYIYKCNNCSFKTMFPRKLEELEICPICGDIVIYRYTNNNNERIYKCFNMNCNYSKIINDK